MYIAIQFKWHESQPFPNIHLVSAQDALKHVLEEVESCNVLRSATTQTGTQAQGLFAVQLICSIYIQQSGAYLVHTVQHVLDVTNIDRYYCRLILLILA